MIPVSEQTEPADFDVNVRAKGLAHLTEKGFALLAQPLSPKADPQPYWRACLTHYTTPITACVSTLSG